MNDNESRRQDAITVYHAYWDSYLKGDMEKMAYYIDDEFQVIGSTEGEVFLNKKESMHFYESTADQIAGKVDFRNRNIQAKIINGCVAVTEFSDAYIFIEEEWLFYSKLRLSSLLEKKEDGWKFVLQHGSVPDSKTEEGEQIAFEKIQKENLALRDAVKRRTTELENKNRELEIEACLEKVRTVAMAMRERKDMLEVCKSIAIQLEFLGVREIRNVQTAIFYKDRGTYMNYEYYAKHTKTIITETVYTNNRTHNEFALKMMKGKGEFFVTQVTDLKEWLAYQKTTNVFIDSYLETATSLNYYWFSLGPVAQGISSYVPLGENDITLFKRFMSVFELAYHRFLDIEKAEAQAREARIEASLEKVRAVAMAMRERRDMLEVCRVISDQLKQFNVKNIRNVQTIIINESKGLYLNYQYFTAYDRMVTEETDPAKHPTVLEVAHGLGKSADAFFSGRLDGQKLDEFRKYRETENQSPDPLLDEAEAIYYHFYSIGQGGLGISAYQPVSDEGLEIFKRFHNVFKLAYRRFLDIEQAEAQAREAQIEAALERVRAQAMSMIKSDELLKVCESVFNELKLLGFTEIDLRNTQIIINNDEREMYYGYQYSDYIGGEIAEVPYDLHPVIRMLNEKLKQSTDAFADIEISGAAMDDWKTFVNSFPQKPDEKLNAAKELHYYFYSVGIGALGISSFKSLSEENLHILQRLRNVFNLSYQRYADIALAETQAREAQIEASLERVRSLALGMHRSEEVGRVSDGFFAEFNKLTVKILGCSIVVIDEEKDSMELWRARSEVAVKPFAKHSFSSTMTILKKNLPDFFLVFYKALQEKNNSLMCEFSGSKRIQFFNAVTEQGKYSEKEKAKLFKSIPNNVATHYIFFKLGYLVLISENILPDENLAIARRFVDVFDFAYTRFLDIKKAEEQAREARIEAALERVRARSMAMHSSHELVEASDVMFAQLEKLEITALRIGICTIDSETGAAEIWSRSEHKGKAQNSILGVVPPGTHPVFDEMVKAWREKKPWFVSERVGEEVKEYYAKVAPCLSYPLPEKYNERESISTFFFTEGSLNVISLEPLAEEECQIMMRFAKAFGQMYTRFLDLQNAEAQNKIIQAENTRKTKELEEARQMQLSMLPKELPQLPHLDIAVFMQTATEVGGDYYDFVMHDDGSIDICLGDATGHGMKAGIMVSSMKSIFTTNAPKMNMEQFFETANTGIKSMNLMRMMMGLVMVHINAKTFKLINAGMPPVFFYSSKSGSIQEIKEHGMPVGAMHVSKYNIVDGSLQKGDALLLVSDGMPELTNAKNEMFGYNRLLQTFNTVADKTPAEIIDHLKNVAAHWTDNKDPDDDVTFVVIKVQ